MEDRKSNARIAWDEFIRKFSLCKENELEYAPLLQTMSGTAESVVGSLPLSKETGQESDDDRKNTSGEIAAVSPRTTVIGENVEISGNCKINGDIEVYGVINGDVSAGGKISVFGKITGNLSGASIFLSAADVKGSVTTEGTVELDSASNLSEGKIVARNIISNGNTSCDMEISEIARFHSSAHVTGDIRTVRISIDEGAVIKGSIISE
ncbi:polymer-forming cytoskeletal protein [Oxalobacter aliiformigenes]|uniref:Polymer-forming cytoskeletal protein n=1 Tax=Oxalobacter aliiformigenes TaxID=2946593 RepID=A0ABY7JMU8_9BURK|nr:polymer-forming cytoskeletal protein [Oxalobacter aliiformigenes]WAV92503.1 polymer-forming cytoskeletal protein [Oxalobacter aliiformigenes]WAV95988.1 polymer-forming cytoskeletal protein [Oxalobacter aliiformigenes]WAV98096.1 polymer-forming cytoskeletal protein [Oxalobacter aliiformigenes]